MSRSASYAVSVFATTLAILFAAPATAIPLQTLLPVPKNVAKGALPAGEPAPFPGQKTFKLHSNPGADHVIYLDFNGNKTTAGTVWNDSESFITPAYTIDSNPSSFNDAERTEIQHIWQRVAEDYIPFNVDVTTEFPGRADLKNTGSGDTQWGVRVVIGGSPSQWLNQSAGGVAWVGSFDSSGDADAPAYVFTEFEGYSATREGFVAEAASHEAGHTLGLHHDGRYSGKDEYYQGHEIDDTNDKWAPIMGNSYDALLTQWSQGEYRNANNHEDDLAIIVGAGENPSNGFGFRPDEHSDALNWSSATPLGPFGSGSGIITTPDDQDVFRFAFNGGDLTIDIDNLMRGANLDIGAKLYDWTGNRWSLFDKFNPLDSLDAFISGSFAAGTYLLAIDGVGFGNPLTNGYSDYGSLGQYTIAAALTPATSVPAPGTLALLGLGGVMLLSRRRRRPETH